VSHACTRITIETGLLAQFRIYDMLPSELALRGPKLEGQNRYESTLTDVTDGQLAAANPGVWGLPGAADEQNAVQHKRRSHY